MTALLSAKRIGTAGLEMNLEEELRFLPHAEELGGFLKRYGQLAHCLDL